MKIRLQSGHVNDGCSFRKEVSATQQIESGYQRVLASNHRHLAGWLFGLAMLLLTGMSPTIQAQTLPCSYQALTTNNYSVSIVTARTGATAPGSLTSTGNVIDADLTNFGSIISSGTGGGGSISAQVTSATLPAGSTAGFAVQNTTLASTALPGSLTITTYLNGTLQDVSTATATPLTERSDLVAASGQRVFGIVTTKPYNEIQITFRAAASTLRVYNAFAQYPTLTISESDTDASSPAVSDGAISVTATGGRPPYTYTYTGPNTSTATSSSVLTGRAPGSYTITVTGTNGCTATTTAAVGFPPQFSCTPNIAYLVNSATTPIASTARRINLTTGVSTVIATDVTSGTSVNALAFNPTDNYLWAALNRYAVGPANSTTAVLASNAIVRFDANFAPTYYTNVTSSTGTNSGDIDQNGVYHLYNGNAGTTLLQRINLSSGIPTQLASLNLSQSIPIGDFAFNPIDNNLYSLSATTFSSTTTVATATSNPVLYRITVPTSPTSTVTTATVTVLGPVTGGGINTRNAGSTATTRFFGAVYSDSNGNLYVQDNSTGDTFKIPAVNLLTANQGATATFLSSTSLVIADNDGARCSTSQVATEGSFAFNCGTATIAGSFTAGGSTGQAGTITIPITNATAGIASFTVLTAGFATNPSPYTTTLTTGQTSIIVPITFNGSGSPGTRTVSFDSEQATNAGCSLTVSVTGRPDLTTTINQIANEPVANQANSLPITINNIGNFATSGATSSVIRIPANVTVPATFTSNGFSCSTSGTLVSCSTSATLAAGASTTLAVPFTPTVASIGTFLSFTNTVATSGESNTNNNTATITLTPAVAGQPDLTTSINQPIPALVAGQTSSLPISVSNIGTAITSGPITQTLVIPASVTAPATFTSNGFSCSTLGTLVSCSTSAALAAGTSTTFAVPITPSAAAIGTNVFTTTVATGNESNTNNNTAALSVVVSASVTATPDAGTANAGTGGTAVVNVAANDLVNGAAATLGATGNATVTQVGTYPTGITLNTTTGSVSVAQGTTPGTYTLVYQLCDKLSTPTCATTTATITVTPSITASPDSGTALASGGTAVANVRANDIVNGVPATTANSSLSLVSSGSPGITLNTTTGSVSVAQGTSPGNYTLVYSLCSTVGTTTCTTSYASVTVLPSVTASPDAGTALAAGGTAIANVTTNDVINGVTPVLSGTATNATLTTLSTATGITINASTGSVNVAAGTPPGTYTLVYQLCTTATPIVCATTTATVTVLGPDLTIAIGQPSPGLLVGQTSNLPIVVSNIGAAPTSGPVSFTLSIPASVSTSATFTSNGFTCATSGTLVSCSSPAIITNGASTTVQVPITPLPAATGTSPVLSATVATANESNPNNNTATTTAGPVAAPDLTILIGQASPALVVGQTSSVPVTISNVGTAPTAGPVSFTLGVPASVTVPATFTSNGFGCVTSGTLVTCSSPATITNGTSTIVSIPLTPLPAATGTSPVLTATVAVGNEGNPNNNTAVTTVTPAVVAPDLTVSIGQPTPVLTVGLTSTVPVIVSNIGTAPTAGPVSFTLSIPVSTTAPATFTSNGFGCVTSGTLVTCSSSATLVNGGNVTVSVPVTATAVAVSPVFSATVATANESNPNNNTATITANTVLAPDLTVSINQPAPVLVARMTSSVLVTINNIGSATTLGPVSFTLSVPATLTVTPSFSSNGFTCAVSGTLVSCSSSAALANGASTTLAIPITPRDAAVGTTPVLSGTVATAAESNVNNNTAVITVTTPVAGQPDLIVAIGQPSPALVVGQTSSVPVSLSNIGTAPTAGPVSFTLSIPANVSASATFTSNGFTCATSGTLVSCNSPTAISNGASTTVLVPITPLAASTGTTPILSATVATGNESNPNNNTTTTTVLAPVTAPDLTIALGQPSPALVVGQTGSVPVSLSNIGTAPTAGPVSFTLSIPANVSASATFTSNGFSCATSGTLVSCSSPAIITNGTSVTIVVPITPLTASAGTSQPLSATVATPNESNVTNNTATITVTVSASVNASPDSGTASAGTGGNAVADVRTNDLVNGALSTTANSSLSLVSSQNPGITLNTSTGSVSVAQGTAPGSYTLTYQLCDKLTPTTCATALVSVTVTPSVTAGADAGNVPATGGTAITNVRANDLVNGQPATVANSTLTPVGTYPTGISLDPATGSLSVAQGTAPGSYTLAYQLCDKLTPTTCTTALATITITPIVTASPDAGTVNSGIGGNAVVNVRVNDGVNGQPATAVNSTLTPVGTYPTGISLNPTTGSLSVAVGTTPGSYTLAYQLCDKLTPTTCATALISVTVTPSVTASPDAGTANTGTTSIAVADVRTNDLVNGTLPTTANSSLSLVSTSPGITLNLTTGAVSVAQGTAPGSYTLVYQLCSTLGSTTCTTSYASVTVTGSAPLVTPDIANTQLNTPVSGNLLTNDSDPQGLPLTASLLSPPAVGTVLVNPDGSYTYTPPTNFTGTVSFCYSVSNTAGLSGSACVSINVVASPVLGNNRPIANNDNTRTTQNTAVTIAVLANDTDPDSITGLNGQLSNPAILSQPAQGTAVVNPTGTITYTPPANFTGIVSFPYQVCDQATPALCATATVSVNVLPMPPGGTIQKPVLVDDALLTKINTPKSGDVSTNDSDPQGLPLTYTANQPTSGTVVMSPTGSYTYTPAPGFTGPARFSYSACNSSGQCAQATTNILVQALAPQVSLSPQVYLQGALFGVTLPGVLMRDDLRTKGYIPATNPYAYLAPITPVAPISPSVTAVTGANAIVDWVFVELRNDVNPSVIIDSRAALLQRDGDIVGVDGVSPVVFSQANPGSYYVAVRHRNHLGVMSLNPLALSPATTTVDFRNPNTPTFTYTGTSSYTQVTIDQAQVVVQQGVALWAGNALLDNAPSAPHNFVFFQGTGNDVNAIYQQISGNPLMSPLFKLKGYYSGDVNLNGETIFQGTGNDAEFINQNVINNHPGNVLKLPYFKIREQLP